MSHLYLTFSREYEADVTESVKAELSAYFNIEGPYIYFQKSADSGSGPQLIQLIGDYAAWLPLATAVSVYFSTLAKKAADATWDGLSLLFKKDDVKPLANVVNTLANAAQAVEGDVEIILGIDIPDKNWGTAMVIKSKNPEEIACALASFVSRVELLAKEMEKVVAEGNAPLARAIITLEEDCSLLVRWQSQKDFNMHEKRIS